MGRNANVSKQIARKLSKLPGRVHEAGMEEAIFSLPASTWQDSGRAAFNWKAEAGISSVRFYYSERGADPVGQRGDLRSVSGQGLGRVSLHRLREAKQLLTAIRNGSIKQSSIANPITDIYADNAKLKAAMEDTKAKIESAMKTAAESWSKR